MSFMLAGILRMSWLKRIKTELHELIELIENNWFSIDCGFTALIDSGDTMKFILWVWCGLFEQIIKLQGDEIIIK